MMSWVAATKSAPSRKNTPAVPPNVNSSHTAERTMFCDTSTAIALRPVNRAMIQNRRLRWSIPWSRPRSHGGIRRTTRRPGAGHELRGRHCAYGHQLENRPSHKCQAQGGDQIVAVIDQRKFPGQQLPDAHADKQSATDRDEVAQAGR